MNVGVATKKSTGQLLDLHSGFRKTKKRYECPEKHQLRLGQCDDDVHVRERTIARVTFDICPLLTNPRRYRLVPYLITCVACGLCQIRWRRDKLCERDSNKEAEKHGVERHDD